MVHRRYTLQEYNEIVRLFKDGNGFRKISRMTGICRVVLKNWIKGKNMPRIISINDKLRIKNLVEKNKNVIIHCAKCGKFITKDTVYHNCKNAMEGKNHTDKSNLLISKRTIEMMNNEKLREYLSLKAKEFQSIPEIKKNNSEKHKELWKDKNSTYNTPEFMEKLLKGLMKRPTSFEQKIIILCSKNRLPFVYTGDGRIFIGNKNPDFVNEEKKIIIEVFLNYFKIKGYGSVENYIKERGEHFSKLGYKTIFIREEEIMDKNWEEICLNKINKII